MAFYLAVIELDGQSGGRDDERERAAFEAALQRGYPEDNRVGYSGLHVRRFQKVESSRPTTPAIEKLLVASRKLVEQADPYEITDAFREALSAVDAELED